jgi:F-box protein 11
MKPIMRCAEALAALGMKQELATLLQTAADTYPQDARELLAKENLLAPNCSFRVGKNRDFSSIADALLVAPAGSEIIVDPGVYRETLYINKPISIRSASLDNDQAAIQALEGNGNTRWVTIEVENRCAVVCRANSHRKTPSHFIGLEIICKGDPSLSVHAAFVASGIAVFRNCLMTSSSGPVVATENSETVAIFQSCAIRNGAQGGILAVGLSQLSLHQVYSCHHAASGLELRTGATCSIEGCHFYANERQGMVAWQAGSLTAKNSFIHSNQQESGVFVSESEAWLDSCWIYGNAMAGVVAQAKGSLSVSKCEIHDNPNFKLFIHTSLSIIFN